MKYIVLVCDGMADYPVKELDGRTPLEAAKTPNFDLIAKSGELGRAKTIPDKMSPASDVANLSILGYDPAAYYSGRGPLEAANLRVKLEDGDVAFRCNLITVGQDKIIDYSAGHISSSEAEILIKFLDAKMSNAALRFYPGMSYRHLLLYKNGVEKKLENIICRPPHDIIGKSVSANLPQGENSKILIDLMQESFKLLQNHEINHVRIDLKENPANMIWLWGQGKNPSIPLFAEKYGLKGSVISAVDLIKGLGRIIGMDVIEVIGATGYYDTNYAGKAQAALKSLEKKDFVFIHVEAPDEAGHNGDLREKITAIERCDQLILEPILKAFDHKRNFRIMVLPDHATPVSLKTHTADPICFGIYGKGIISKGFANFSEKEAENSTLYFEHGYKLMEYFIKQSG